MRIAYLFALGLCAGACVPRPQAAGPMPLPVPVPPSASAATLPALRAGEEQIGRWRVGCETNQTRGTVTCSAVNRTVFPRVSVAYSRDLSGRVFGPFVHAGTNDCPGYAQILRVDQRPPERIFYPDRPSNDAAERRVVAAMEVGTTLRTEDREWPYCRPDPDAFEVSGFGDAHPRLRAMIRAARP